MIRVSAFKWVPPFAQGYVRDLRVRWALEEAGMPYEEKLLSFSEKDSDAYRQLQPFAQIPAFEDGDLKMFESGAIVLHIAGRSPALMPEDHNGRERTTSWVFAALNSIEPPVQELGRLDAFYAKEEWAKLRRPSLEDAVRNRLKALADWLGDREWLEGRFTAGDLMMVSVLRIIDDEPVLQEFPTLVAYRDRGMARPAFRRALEAQLRPFRENAPKAA